MKKALTRDEARKLRDVSFVDVMFRGWKKIGQTQESMPIGGFDNVHWYDIYQNSTTGELGSRYRSPL